MSDVSDDTMTATAPRHTRRLSDKILIAFHQACDLADFEVAERLLKVVETVLAVPRETPIDRERREQETLVAAHERLWQRVGTVRHADVSAGAATSLSPIIRRPVAPCARAHPCPRDRPAPVRLTAFRRSARNASAPRLKVTPPGLLARPPRSTAPQGRHVNGNPRRRTQCHRNSRRRTHAAA